MNIDLVEIGHKTYFPNRLILTPLMKGEDFYVRYCNRGWIFNTLAATRFCAGEDIYDW